MNKTQLVEVISEKADISKAAAARALDAMLEGITESLAAKEPVQFVGFGTFKVNERAARTGRNPKTGEAIEIKAASVPAFTAGKALKDTVNK
ncbi:HU family DNA-binding protein [Vibrio fluvialis]|uniref:HU family DNA-binding protein n=1 Tax=Vibrio fluvialis TaxID=676 RepID=UPI00192B971F|nr:HU family DNA-binding protein [Vibrio fluvialis]MBL4244501.1 HU family DNA-binding protein [Vibrio fluvialis]MBL4253391.1 HU family DNA-binding protein [Vibrio fluvialis]HBK7909645.1 HU family DNA-binding protein [Vibrio cholerae]